MMLYTIVPREAIFFKPPKRAECLSLIDTVFLEGEHTEQGFRVQRVCSTNPKDYLNTRCCPGAYYGKPERKK